MFSKRAKVSINRPLSYAPSLAFSVDPTQRLGCIALSRTRPQAASKMYDAACLENSLNACSRSSFPVPIDPEFEHNMVWRTAGGIPACPDSMSIVGLRSASQIWRAAPPLRVCVEMGICGSLHTFISHFHIYRQW